MYCNYIVNLNNFYVYIIQLVKFFILILSIMVFTQIRSNADDAKERKAKEEKFQKQQDEEIALKEQLNNLNNKDYIEKIARDDYYLSNDGEVIFKLPKDKGKK